MTNQVPCHPTIGIHGMCCCADQLASSAGLSMLHRGGTAADAAVSAAAAMAVVGPHLCGLGGDVLAMVKAPSEEPVALMAIGRAGSGADPDRLRAEGADDMPLRHDVRCVTVPAAVDGWLALHGRFGRLPWTTVLEPAINLAERGFAASTLLALASNLIADGTAAGELCFSGPLEAGQAVRLPGIARTLRSLAQEGRTGFYEGEFGQCLIDLGNGEFSRDDLLEPLARWEAPACLRAFDHDLWTVPPPSQGYLTLAGAWITERLGLPEDLGDPLWAATVAAACRSAGRDRPDVLFDGADPSSLLASARLEGRLPLSEVRSSSSSSEPSSSSSSEPSPMPASNTSAEPKGPGSSGAQSVGGTSPAFSSDGDTTHLCVVDDDGLAVSLTQSNALDFGSHLVAGTSTVYLHNRGIGFSLRKGHPGEYGPAKRPSHTLSPACVTRPDGSLSHVLGAMGGDAQPQVLLQLLARMLVHRQDAATAITSPRFAWSANAPFRLWQEGARLLVVESDAPPQWVAGLRERGYHVRVIGAHNPVDVGCAQIIAIEPNEGGGRRLVGATDPRSSSGAALAC